MIKNLPARAHGNPTGRKRTFVVGFNALPGEELLCPELEPKAAAAPRTLSKKRKCDEYSDDEDEDYVGRP